MEKRKSNRGNFEIEDLGDVELSLEQHEKAKRMIAAADAELDATRVNFRWQREPLALIKRVAQSMGVPYQTYMKQVLYRQALDDYSKIQKNQLLSPSCSAPAPVDKAPVHTAPDYTDSASMPSASVATAPNSMPSVSVPAAPVPLVSSESQKQDARPKS